MLLNFKWLGVSVLLLGGLAGCAGMAAQRQQDAWQQARQIMQDCQVKRIAGELPNRVASVQCSNGPAGQVIAASGYPHMDLVQVFFAYRLAAAQRMDEGTITEADANLQFAELYTRLRNEEQRRGLLAQQAYSQRLQGYGAMLQGLAAWNQSVTPPASIGPITCWGTGNMVTCR